MDESKRCTAKLSDGTRQCKKAAMHGQRVCRSHGGASPQARRAARDRLYAMADEAIDALQKALAADDIRAAIRAAQLVLDRAGVGPLTDVEAFYREQAPTLRRLIDGILSSFGIRVGPAHVNGIVSRELKRVSAVELDATDEAIEVPALSTETKRRIADELAGQSRA